jgi:hypothetical protein
LDRNYNDSFKEFNGFDVENLDGKILDLKKDDLHKSIRVRYREL